MSDTVSRNALLEWLIETESNYKRAGLKNHSNTILAVILKLEDGAFPHEKEETAKLRAENEQLHGIIERQETVRLRNFELTKELERALQDNDRLRAVLKWYAAEIIYSPNVYKQWQPVTPVLEDGGKRAREALSISETAQYAEECDWCGTETLCSSAAKSDGMPGDICAACREKLGTSETEDSPTIITSNGFKPVPAEKAAMIKQAFDKAFEEDGKENG